VPASAGAGPWEALVLDVEHPDRSALRVEVAGSGSLALRQNDMVVLMAQVDGDLFGVEYASTGQFRSPIPPIRAAYAASLRTDDPSEAWQARWAHHVAAALTSSTEGPLNTEGILAVVHDRGLRAQESHDLPARLEIQKEVGVLIAPGAQQEAVARDGAHAT